jgi:hypothetical protein
MASSPNPGFSPSPVQASPGGGYQTGSVANATYPIVAEIWTIFEATLMVQAKRLVEDIAQHQGRDSKELWTLIKPKVKIPLFDTEFPEPTLCSHIIGSQGTAIIQRCRSPCLLGFGTCAEHSHTHSVNTQNTNLESVDSIKDMDGQVYYVDKKGLARDKQGKPKGIVKEDVLYLFEKA